jgi:hypothetical protein
MTSKMALTITHVYIKERMRRPYQTAKAAHDTQQTVLQPVKNMTGLGVLRSKKLHSP